ncbi:MAG: efflux RND transporter periplasmic adaptor subunit [Myxococcales bacterium]|nr:efflux RND transporter periplasmic adaptor subunit [Myxococcales bacterium]
MRTPRSIAAALALAATASLLAACSADEAADTAAEGELVAVEPVVAIDFTERITATGELRATNHADIAAEVDGRVTELLAEEGAAVAEGAALLELDPARRKLDLAAARARVAEERANEENQRREVARLRELRRNDIASTSALDRAETALRLAESRLAGAQAELGVAERALAEATVRAPFGGMVVMRKVSLGEYVQLGTPLVELVALDPIEVVFNVAEVDSARVAKGQMVRVEVAPFPDETFAATVDVVSPTIDPATRTLRVKARLENPDGRLRPGLFARADLGIADRRGVAVVSDQAVLQRTDGSVVFTVTPADMRAHRRLIEVGGFREGRIEVASGIGAGELVVVRGQSGLVDGQLVRFSVDSKTADGAPSLARDGEPDEVPVP